MRAHLQHRPRALAAARRMAEAGIEEACVMHPELAHQRIERHHLGGVIGRHAHRLARGQDVELIRLQHQRPALRDRLPVIARIELAGLVHVDQPGVAARPEAHRQGDVSAGQIHRQRKPAVNIGLAGGQQRFALVELGDQRVGALRLAEAEADLRQARAGARQNGKGARADLGEERAFVAIRHLVERAAEFRNDAGEDINPPGRAFRIGRRRDALRQAQGFQQRDDVDASGLQHRAVA